MSLRISSDLCDDPTVDAAIKRANEVIDCWTVCAGDEAMKVRLTVGWSGVDLVEEIACAILESQGYDADALYEGVLREAVTE